MNYYQFHIGDYSAHTAHLTPIEDCAYRRLLDAYYLNERPFVGSVQDVAREIGMREHIEDVEYVLKRFFEHDGDAWRNKRADAEIAAYRVKKSTHWTASLTKEKRAEMAGERRATKISATPKWLTKEQRYEIACFYERAATLSAKTGIKHEVDHVVPLRSNVVCGLHVPWNLDVIPAYKNRAKSNSFEVA